MKSSKTLSEKAVYSRDMHNKIELVNYPHSCENCVAILVDINRLFYDSYQYQIDKEYQFSVDALKKAFNKTYELIDPLEQECARIFRGVITDSLENIYHELRKMTRSLFRKNRYRESFRLAEETLREFKRLNPAGNYRRIKSPSQPLSRVYMEDRANDLVAG